MSEEVHVRIADSDDEWTKITVDDTVAEHEFEILACDTKNLVLGEAYEIKETDHIYGFVINAGLLVDKLPIKVSWIKTEPWR